MGKKYICILKRNKNSVICSANAQKTEIAAKDALQIESGKDTNILGSTVQGNKVTAKIGGNLNIETLQEKKPTRRRTHRQTSISRGIFAQENSPSPRSVFPRAEERSTPTIEAQEASPASSLEKAASTSTSKRTPTSRAPSLQAKRMRERTASAQGRSLSAIWRTVRTTAQRA